MSETQDMQDAGSTSAVAQDDNVASATIETQNAETKEHQKSIDGIDTESGETVDENKKETSRQSYNRRKEKKIEELTAALAERDQKIKELSRPAPADGERYDDLLGENIPASISADDYKKLVKIKLQQQQRQTTENAIVNDIKTKIEAVSEKMNDDVRSVFGKAVQDGILSERLLLSASTEESGVEFLYHLIKDNPKLAEKIGKEGNYSKQAVMFGKALATFEGKPPSRTGNGAAPPTVVKEQAAQSKVSAPKNSMFIDTHKRDEYLSRRK